MSLTLAEQFVEYALGIGALELIPEGRKLNSGRMSPYFFNSGLFKTGYALSRLAGAYASLVYKDSPGVIFGPAYKGIPLVAAAAVILGESVEYAFNRKEVKDHGEGGIVVGAPLKGKRVEILDDAMATGTAAGEAVEIIRAQGGIPIGCIVAFDRQERGKESELSAVQEFQKKYGIPVCAIATLADLISFLEKVPPRGYLPNVGEMLEKILIYRKQYGAS